MKNIMIIDGAENCTYELFQATDKEFKEIFSGKEVVFIEDLVLVESDKVKFNKIFAKIWDRPIDKKDAIGIHGTIFYEQYYKKEYFPNGYWDG